MNWVTSEEIQSFLEARNYDIRVSGNARWIDQKCAADVVTVVADCILQYAADNPSQSFTTKDVWHANYTIENVESIFKKPGVADKKAKNEYDKFFQQPMEMFAYAGVLSRQKIGARNVYKVLNPDLLSYISLRERNALTFLQLYIKKVLSDSGMYPAFEKFFQLQTKAAYDELKSKFEKFLIDHTKINNYVECRRIFIKIINPLAYLLNSKGTEKGRISRHKITYDMLMYNRDNFRDLTLNKPKDLTRKEYAETLNLEPSAGLAAYMSQKAKRVVRQFNDKYRNGLTEVLEPNHLKDQAVHIHHIFPESQYLELCSYYENLIALTPTQHLSYAHPNGHTQKINEQYQHICLLAKADSIEETLADPARDQIYDFVRFIYVLRVGLDDERFAEIEEGDFDGLVTTINLAYSD
jgi:hypothetical protein